MKRPLALVGFTYLLAQAAAVFFGFSFGWYAAAFCGTLFLISLLIPRLRKEKAAPLACITAAVSLGAFCLAQINLLQPLDQLKDQDAVISGVICEIPYESNQRYYYVVQVDRVELEGAPQSMKLRMSTTHALEGDVYDRVTGRVHLFLPEGGTGFTSSAYYQSKGIHMLSYLYEYEDVRVQPGTEKPFYYYALKCRQSLIHTIRNLLPPEQAGISAGILLGEKQGMPEQVRADFQEIGVSHLLSVSGLHVTILTQCLFLLLGVLRIRKRAAGMLSIAGVLLFMAITGFAPSVMRAGIMVIFTLLGIVIRKEPDTLNSLGTAALVLTLCNPFAAGDIGLLLSFTATLGLILLSGKLKTRLYRMVKKIPFGKRLLRSFASSLSGALAVTLFTFPVILLTFQEFSIIAPLSNFLLVVPAMAVMICTAAATLLSFTGVFSFLAMPFALMAGIGSNYLKGCASLLARIPYCNQSAGQDFLYVWLAGTLLLLSVALWKPGVRRVKTAALLSGLLLFVGGLSYQLFQMDVVQISVMDAGDGCAVTLNYRGRGAVVSCGGSRYAPIEIDRCLQKRNIRSLDYMVLPSTEQEACNGAQTVIERYRPKVLFLPESAQQEEKLLGSMSEAGEAYLFKGQTQTCLWDFVFICADADNGWVSVSIDDLELVIVPKSGNRLPEQARDCHFYITGQPDGQGDWVSCDYMIFSLNRETMAQGIRCYSPASGTALWTGSQGNLTIERNSQGVVSIRRC
ncbi:MAG: DUF4131 domain-containing protein [Clostridiales bacterium]|jgi:competence protein ComEC|nr:DUF4131 domain-containing protein [Clostridiales bacterium]